MDEIGDFYFEVSEDEEALLETQILKKDTNAWAFLQPGSYSRNRLQASKPYAYK